MTIEHQLWSQHSQALAAEGDSTVVMFDYENKQPVAISAKVRACIESLENRSFS